MSVAIQRCEEGQTESAKQVIQSVLTNEFATQPSTYSSDDLNDLLGSYGKLGEAFFVATSGGKVIGTVGVKREDDRTAFLRRLFVLPEYRGKQVGRKLIERAIEFCREVGYQELVFKTTSVMESAIRLCEKNGFVLRGHIELGPIRLLKYVFNVKSKNGQAASSHSDHKT
jgi:GNAT superfamily N-acetyltransferase